MEHRTKNTSNFDDQRIITSEQFIESLMKCPCFWLTISIKWRSWKKYFSTNNETKKATSKYSGEIERKFLKRKLTPRYDKCLQTIDAYVDEQKSIISIR